MRITSQPYNRLKEALFYNRATTKYVLLLLVFISAVLLIGSVFQDEKAESIFPVLSTRKVNPVFDAFYNCVYPKIIGQKDNYDRFWLLYVHLTEECDDLPEYKTFDLQPIANTDEIKYVSFPKQKEENITMVTLGIGHDVDAELRLKKMWPGTEFFGVDPSPEINKDLYEVKLGGNYFQVAVSGQGGMQKSYIFRKKYRDETTMHIGADYFFGNMLKRPRVDILWVDTEGNEFPVLDMIHRGGPLDRRGVKICQMNVEIHKDLLKDVTGEKQKFHDFVWKIMEDRKYIIVKPFYVYWFHDFIRVVVLNVEDPECTSLYMR
ncbi:unnamed protein product [Caenorhabditis nigoni]